MKISGEIHTEHPGMKPLRWESVTPIDNGTFAVCSILITFIPGHARKSERLGLAGRAGP